MYKLLKHFLKDTLALAIRSKNSVDDYSEHTTMKLYNYISHNAMPNQINLNCIRFIFNY